MATLDELAVLGLLHKVKDEDVLSDEQQPFRRMYLSPDVRLWVTNTLPHIVSDGYVDGAMNPREQAFGALRDFISGCHPGDFEKPPCRLRPEQFGVWELRTADLRFFGVFPIKDTFIWISACTKSQATKNANDGYSKHQRLTLLFMNDLDLDEPKLLHGEMQDVLTI